MKRDATVSRSRSRSRPSAARLARWAWPLAALAAAAAAVGLDARITVSGDPSATVLIASLDTPPAHFRNGLMRRFAAQLAEQSGGRLKLELYEAGQLMSDRDVAKALAWGAIDLALPADSKIARFEPNANLLSLPEFPARCLPHLS